MAPGSKPSVTDLRNRLLRCLICWGLTLQDGDLLPPQVEPGSDFPLRHLFPFQQSLSSTASLDRRKPTPLSWFSSSSIPEHSTVSPVAILNLPQEFYPIWLTPRILTPYLCISLITWAHFPVSNNVLTFHCPIFTHTFGGNNFIASLYVILCFARCSNWVLASGC